MNSPSNGGIQNNGWHDIGLVTDLQKAEVQEVELGTTKIVVSFKNGTFGVVSGVCNHVGGPLAQGRLDGDYLVCPWHNWKFHRITGAGEPGFEEDQVPRYDFRIDDGHLWVRIQPAVPRHKKPHERHPLARPLRREPGPIRVAGISTTAMDAANPRYSTSDALLETALQHAGGDCQTRLIRLNDLKFRNCEGYYSKSAQACTWPCSITQMDPGDQLEKVYEVLVHWADVVVISTPIRWAASLTRNSPRLG